MGEAGVTGGIIAEEIVAAFEEWSGPRSSETARPECGMTTEYDPMHSTHA